MIGLIRKYLPERTQYLECSMKGVAGFTGRGVFRCAAWANGEAAYEISVRGLAGLKAELIVRGQKITELELVNGVGFAEFERRKGAPDLNVAIGDEILVCQNGKPVLTGRLVHAEGARTAFRRFLASARRTIAERRIQIRSSAHQSR